MAFPNFNFTPASILSNVSAGLNLLSNKVNFDVVGIYDSQSLRQLFERARPLKAMVVETSKIMDQPVETGVIISDHHIINPKIIDLPLLIQNEFYTSTYQQIRDAFINATLLTVQTKAGVFPNMIIADMPHQEDPDMFDVITMALRLKEVLFVAPSSIAQPTPPANYAPAAPADTNTIARGLQPPLAITLPASILSYIRTISAWGRR
jgi:hypothetical protein